MEIIIYQQINLKNNPRVFHDVFKTFGSDVIPHKGDFISDSAFKDPYEYEVLQVVINYNDNSCFVRIPLIELESKNDGTSLVEM
ncbi:MAG: hypothetical protein JWN30_847 [Bacilli bacterium]|nr:hypothetical protein [Bacilli bacterium]